MKLKKSVGNVSNVFDDLDDLYELATMNEDVNFKMVSPEVNTALLKLQSVVRMYREGLKEMIDAYLEVQQELTIAEPSVYVAKTKDIKTDKEYFTAKTFWPLKNGRKKEVKIYLGRAKDFDNDTMSIRAKEDAKRKMSETLRRRKDQGEI